MNSPFRVGHVLIQFEFLGPFRLNGCPLRRISQNYVIATKARLNLKGVKVPEHLNDRYFRRIRPKRPKKEEGDIFATKKEVNA